MQKVVLNLCRHLDPETYRVELCCLERLGALRPAFEEAGIEPLLMRKKEGVDWGLILKLRGLLRARKIDILHTHGINPYFYGTLAARLASVRAVVQTDHSRQPFQYTRAVNWSERVLARLTGRLVAVSESVRSDLARIQGVDPCRVTVIENGIRPPRRPAREEIEATRSDLGLDQHDFVIGTVSRLIREKGIGTLIEAAEAVGRELPRARFLVVGEGDERAHFEREVEQRGLTRRFLFTGARTDVGTLLAVFDLFVLPSYQEGLPLGFFAAMAAKKPIVATQVGQIPGAIKSGRSGILVEPGDPIGLARAIVEAGSDPERAARMGEEAFKTFQSRFHVSRMVTDYEALYRALLSEKQR